MRKEVQLSLDKLHRYALIRVWDSRKPRMTFIGLNPRPSVDGKYDSKTLQRCIRFAKREHMGGINVVNLYSYITTSPRVLDQVDKPSTRTNDFWLMSAFQHNGNGKIIAMWGAAAEPLRVDLVKSLSMQYKIPIWCFGLTSSGAPRNPLYSPVDEPLIRWY